MLRTGHRLIYSVRKNPHFSGKKSVQCFIFAVSSGFLQWYKLTLNNHTWVKIKVIHIQIKCLKCDFKFNFGLKNNICRQIKRCFETLRQTLVDFLEI